MTINPFDPKTVFLAKHAQHVVLVHFPIALFLAGVAFDFIGHWTKNRALTTAAYFNFWVAALFSLPVVGTGLGAWQWALEGQKLKGILLLHLILGWTSTILMWWVVLVQRRARRHSPDQLSASRFPLEVIAALAIMVTGHLGGFLSGVNTPS